MFADNDSESCAQENIDTYVHANFGKSTRISHTDQKKIADDLVLRKDYENATGFIKYLFQEIEEINGNSAKKQRELQITKNKLTDMIQQVKSQEAKTKQAREETKQAREELENREAELKKSLKKIAKEKTALHQKYDSLRERMEQQLSSHPEQSDDVDKMKENHQQEVTKLTEDATKLQEVIRRQEKELKAMNSKVHAIMNDVPDVQSDSHEDDNSPNMSALECLDRILAHFRASSSSPQKAAKKPSKERRQQLLKQLNEMKKTVAEQQTQLEKERKEAKKCEKAQQRNINNLKQDIQSLTKKVKELNSATPETQSRSDSLVSQTALPLVDMLQRSFMVAQQPHPSRPVRRQQSNDAINSWPIFPRPAQAPVTSNSSFTPSISHQLLQCVQCGKRINHTQLITETCQYHTGRFNGVQQRWLCCQHPFKHPGCRWGRHLPKK